MTLYIGNHEKYIYKPFIDFKLSIGKELPKYKKLSEYDKVMILRKYSSLHNIRNSPSVHLILGCGAGWTIDL